MAGYIGSFVKGGLVSADLDNVHFTSELKSTTLGTSNLRLGKNAGDSIVSGGNYNVVVGDEAGTAITTGDQNTAVGYRALFTNSTGGNNVALGTYALDLNTTGASNTALGYLSLSANTEGTLNVAVGKDSMDSNTTGSNNVAVGVDTLQANLTASNNTAVGYQAGLAVTTGTKNTLIGSAAGDALTDSDSNVAVGYLALSADTLGQFSVAIGDNALAAQNFTTATNSFNVAVGKNAGLSVTTGVHNTFVGSLAGDGTDDGARNTAVGNNSLSANCGDDNTCMGDDAGEKVTGSRNTLLGALAGDEITTGLNNTFIGYGNSASAVGGNNQTVLGYAVTCVGNGNFTFGDGTTDSNIANGATSITAPSDQRYKEEIADATAGLAFIKDLRPVTFKWKKEKDLPTSHRAYVEGSEKRTMNDYTNHGFIAQEVKTAIDAHSEIKDGFDMWCTDSQDDGGRQRLGDASLMPLMVKAVQELSTALDAALDRIAALEG